MTNISEKFQEILSITPDMLRPVIGIQEINQPVTIYQGNYKLLLETATVNLTGTIFFSWKPSPGVRFSGIGNHYSADIYVKSIGIEGYSIKHGSAIITRIAGSGEQISGIINNPMVLFKKTA